MFKNIQIRTLMGSTIAILLVLLMLAGGSGVMLSRYAVRGMQSNLDDVSNQATMGEIRQRMEANRSQVLQALQHNPGTKYAAMHDHPLGNHFNAIQKNTADIKALWSHYQASIDAADERRLAEAWYQASGSSAP
ncbi:MAG: Tar ligand binding domain-containing protein [Gammaproteobacteria bacterium]